MNKRRLKLPAGPARADRFLPLRLTACAAFGWMLFGAVSCDSIFPSQSKPDVPADHTRNISGALHKPGWNDPMALCVECHGDSLQGGVQRAGDRRVVAPSCYQCHGAVWENGEDGEGDDGGENDD
jgi:hypothetical protein